MAIDDRVIGRVCAVEMKPGQPIQVTLGGRTLQFCPRTFQSFAETVAVAAARLEVQRSEALMQMQRVDASRTLH